MLALKRTELLDTLRVLPPDRVLAEVADVLLRATALLAKAIRDAEHIALAAIHQVTYVATWNFGHIANPVIAAKIYAVLRLLGYTPSVLCSPDQLLALDRSVLDSTLMNPRRNDAYHPGFDCRRYPPLARCQGPKAQEYGYSVNAVAADFEKAHKLLVKTRDLANLKSPVNSLSKFKSNQFKHKNSR